MCSTFLRKSLSLLLVSFLGWQSLSSCYGENNRLSTDMKPKLSMSTSSLSLQEHAGGEKNTTTTQLVTRNEELYDLLDEADTLLAEYEALVISLRNQNALLVQSLQECEAENKKRTTFLSVGFGIAVVTSVVATIIAITK